VDKEELISITIQKLIDHFNYSPESFEYNDGLIVWQPKITLNDAMSTIVNDPNNNHAAAIYFNETINELRCYLFLKTPPNLTIPTPNLSYADSVIISARIFMKWRRNYKKYVKLKNLILARDRHRASMNYLKKLSSLFPDVMDDSLLK
jgi:hypothetical protein